MAAAGGVSSGRWPLPAAPWKNDGSDSGSCPLACLSSVAERRRNLRVGSDGLLHRQTLGLKEGLASACHTRSDTCKGDFAAGLFHAEWVGIMPCAPSGFVGLPLANRPRRSLAKPEGEAGSGVGGAKSAMSVMPPVAIWLSSSKREMHRSTSGHTSCS